MPRAGRGAQPHTARRVLEDALAPRRAQRLLLQVELLVLGGDARVADHHWPVPIVLKSFQHQPPSARTTGNQSELILICAQAPCQKKTLIKQLIGSRFTRAQDSPAEQGHPTRYVEGFRHRARSPARSETITLAPRCCGSEQAVGGDADRLGNTARSIPTAVPARIFGHANLNLHGCRNAADRAQELPAFDAAWIRLTRKGTLHFTYSVTLAYGVRCSRQ